MKRPIAGKMPLGQWFREIGRQLDGAGEPAYRQQIERLVPGIRTRGVRVPKIRALVAAFAKEFKPAFDDGCALLDLAAANGSRDEMLFGSFLVARSKKALRALPWSRLKKWSAALDNWETCDQLAMAVAGPLVAADLALVRELETMAQAKRLWQRRFAVATAATLNQRGQSHPEATLAVCRHVVGDPEPMVQKALAWAVRETCKSDPGLAHAFLVRHKRALPPRVLKDAAAKLAPADRRRLLA
jgi:3-methyladenine DNA glycosylase AlkD